MSSANRFLPLFLDLKDRPVLVVGAGKVGLRKVRELLECGAQVKVVSPAFLDGFEVLPCECVARKWQTSDLDGALIVFAATDDEQVNRLVHEACRARSILCNVVDVTPLCDFHSVASVQAGEISIALHSAGKAPGLSAWLRRRLQEWLSGFGDLSKAVSSSRASLRDSIAQEVREDFWRNRDYQALWELCRKEGIKAVTKRLEAESRGLTDSVKEGRVILVGAGPGHPELITRMGLAAIEQATALVHDRLVAKELLDHAPHSCQVFSVGKKGFGTSAHQSEINALIVRLAQEGHRVVRLKGGDPFVFGRGGEEIEACEAVGIPVEVVPGLSSSLTVPTYAGIPVTHRGLSRSFAIVTGHTANGVTTVLPEAETLVFMMPQHSFASLRSQMYEKGWAPGTPASAIQSGTLPDQRVLHSTLESIVEAMDREQLGSPMIIVVGPVAGWAATHANATRGFRQPQGTFDT
ncbi:MAG: hypothetical protein RL318_2029 [Fibrobacterota bacterium]|jgi:uroporphyrin-III C-methyltransferase/precorrin-2 dehydrogenase/sirohydrochlorin ferrochelatase